MTLPTCYLLLAPCSLLLAPCSLLIAHCSLLLAPCSGQLDREFAACSLFQVRELSVRSAYSEFFGIASLGDEILHSRLDFPDPWEHRDNLGNTWLQEHVLSSDNASEPGYSIAYNTLMPFMPDGFEWDFSVHVKGDSRWVNWYVEALHWAATKGVTSPPDGVTIDGTLVLTFDSLRVDNNVLTGVLVTLCSRCADDMLTLWSSGLYLDGFNWDRVTMKRVRKVLSRANPRNLIDYHWCVIHTYGTPHPVLR